MKKNKLSILTFCLLLTLHLMSTTSKAQTSFSATHISMTSGNTACVDISASGFQNLAVVQFSIHYDESLLAFVGFSNLSLLSLDEGDNFSASPGTITFTWVDPNGLTLSDDEIIFSLCFNATSTQNDISQVSFNGTPTFILVGDTEGNTILSNFNNGSVSISATGELEIWNTSFTYIYCENNMGGIFPTIIGGTAPYTYQWTGPNGFLSTNKDISNLVSGIYELTVEDSEGNTTSSSFPLQSTEIEMFPNISPSHCMDDNGSIGLTIDAPFPTIQWSNGETGNYIIALSAGEYSVTVTEGNCTIEETYIVPGGLNLTSSIDCFAPVSADMQVISEIAYEPVTFEWSTGFTETIDNGEGSGFTISSINAPLGMYTVTVTDETGCIDSIEVNAICNTGDFYFTISPEVSHLEVGESTCIDVVVANFHDILNVQFTVEWDETLLDFDEVNNFGLPGLSSFGNFGTSTNGMLSFAWSALSFTGETLEDAMPIFSICFTALAEGSSDVYFSNSASSIEVLDENENSIEVNINNGLIIIGDALWPGDTNHDGIVNQYDLLNIGLGFEATGPARTPQSINWQAYFTESWNQSTPISNIDYKHIDTDGNGNINAADVLALEQNWGEVTDFWENTPPENNTDLASPFYVLPDTLLEGQTVLLDIILGDEDMPVNNVYGLAFTISYDAEIIEPTSVEALFNNSWLGNINANMISIYRGEIGKLHIALTRTDGLEISGSGVIGQMRITIQDVIFRGELVPLNIEIENAKLITYSEENILVQNMQSTCFIDTTTGTTNSTLEDKISIFPIPASDRITVLSKGIQVVRMQLFQMDGKLLQSFENQTDISLKNIPKASYLLKIISEKGVLIKRIIKI